MDLASKSDYWRIQMNYERRLVATNLGDQTMLDREIQSDLFKTVFDYYGSAAYYFNCHIIHNPVEIMQVSKTNT